jgi:hypothetical protein
MRKACVHLQLYPSYYLLIVISTELYSEETSVAIQQQTWHKGFSPLTLNDI